MTNSVTQRLQNEDELLLYAASLAQRAKNPLIIYLNGPLGAGKTTFSRGFLRGLGYQGSVKSPTYTLVEPYHFPFFTVFHFDLYRIHNEEELECIGIRDYFNQNAICLIEWPEKGKNLLPSADLDCYLSFLDEGRELIIMSQSQKGEALLSNK